MKVVMSTPYAYPFSGYAGAERYVHWLSKYLVKAGCEVKIITSPDTKDRKDLTHDGIQYEFLGPPIPTYKKIAWLYHYGFQINLARRLRDTDFDILHSYHLTSYMYLHMARRKPVIIEPFGLGRLCEVDLPEVDRMFRGIVLKRPLMYCAQHCEAIAAEGDTQAEELSRLLGVSRDKIFNLPDGVELDIIRDHVAASAITRADIGIDDVDLVLINVNRLDHNKGVSYLIDALSMLDINARLILVGSGPEWPKIEKQIDRLGLTNKVHHYENIPDHLMYQLYTLADISVTPTLWEGLPLVMLEAMATGRAIVATNISDIPNVIKGNGITVPPGDATAIRDAVLKIYQGKVAEDMGKESIRLIQEYDWQLTARKALDKYKEVLGV